MGLLGKKMQEKGGVLFHCFLFSAGVLLVPDVPSINCITSYSAKEFKHQRKARSGFLVSLA